MTTLVGDGGGDGVGDCAGRRLPRRRRWSETAPKPAWVTTLVGVGVSMSKSSRCRRFRCLLHSGHASGALCSNLQSAREARVSAE